MCDTVGHEHWCSVCGKNLNKEPKDSYIEIEWTQSEKDGRIIEDKKMICKEPCLNEMENVKTLNEYFKGLQYHPYGHVFCSTCKKDITQEHLKKLGIKEKILDKIGFDKLPKVGEDYQSFQFKEHKDKKHFIKVVVLCKDCEKKEFNYKNIEKLKKLGRNPLFKPEVKCPNIENCKQWKVGDEFVNCKHIVVGRDRESLNIGLLCGRKHKGSLPLPFDDGFSIVRPRKTKGAAVVNPVTIPPLITKTPQDTMNEYMDMITKMFKEHKLGKFAEPSNNGKLTELEMRILNIEKKLNIIPTMTVPVMTPIVPMKSVSINGTIGEEKVSSKIKTDDSLTTFGATSEMG